MTKDTGGGKGGRFDVVAHMCFYQIRVYTQDGMESVPRFLSSVF